MKLVYSYSVFMKLVYMKYVYSVFYEMKLVYSYSVFYETCI